MVGPRRQGTGGCRNQLAVALLFLIGLYVILGLDFLGWSHFENLGTRLYRLLVGFLFLFVASLQMEKNRLRRRLDEVYEGLNMLLYGKNYKRDREAIRILIGALSADKEDVRIKAWGELKRLSGQDFALDAEVWRSWWAANEKKFALRSKRPEG
jgi:hypothetical protein